MSEEHIDVVEARGTVLVVDDFAHNRTMIREVLENDGHTVTEACDGESALEMCAENPPDCMLLDIMLPGLDGYDVCRALKSKAATCHIPILLITALNERDDRIRGIAVGASDFLNKPIDVTDICLRVRNSIYSKSIIDRARSKARNTAEHDDSISRIIGMALHSQRGPLTVLGGYLSLLRQRIARSDDDKLTEFVSQAITAHQESADSLQTAIDVYLPVTDPAWALRLAATEFRALLTELCETRKADGEVLELELPEDEVVVVTESKVMIRCILRIVAFMRVMNKNAAPIKVSLKCDAGDACLTLEDQGPSWHNAVGDSVFDRFSPSGKLGRPDAGVGLAFAKRVIDLHGGGIRLGAGDSGTRVCFTLPLSPATLLPRT